VKVVPGLGAPHDGGAPAGDAGRAAVSRPPGVTWGSLPSTWMVSLLASCPPRLTHAPRVRLGVPDHIRQRLAQRGQRVIAEFHGNRLSNGPISVILGLNPSIGPTTGKDWPRARWSWGRHKRLTNQTLVVAQGRAEGVLINGPGEREKRQAITVNIASTAEPTARVGGWTTCRGYHRPQLMSD
jgi:hypothetical protein